MTNPTELQKIEIYGILFGMKMKGCVAQNRNICKNSCFLNKMDFIFKNVDSPVSKFDNCLYNNLDIYEIYNVCSVSLFYSECKNKYLEKALELCNDNLK